MKECKKCNITKPLDEFRKHNECIDGRSNICKSCFKLWTKEYEKTENGFLMRAYRNMKSRITGIQKKKFHLYKDKELLDKDDFYSWAKSSKSFYKLFEDYRLSDFDRKKAPSVDRIDSSKGYTLDNIEWVTMSENSRRSSKTRIKSRG